MMKIKMKVWNTKEKDNSEIEKGQNKKLIHYLFCGQLIYCI